MRVFLILALLLLSGLAGCSSSDDGPTETTDDPTGDLGLTADETTGIIRGVVVDESIQPVAGATITLVGTERSTTSNDQGAFGFSEVEPGEYFVKATKLGWFDAQQSVQVEAGVLDPPAVKLLLIQDLANLPSLEEFVFRGFLECSTTYIALCNVPNDPLAPIIYTGNFTNDRFITYYDIDGAPDWAQSEMVWESTQSLSDRLWLWHSYAENGSFAGSLDPPYVYGASPIMIHHNATQLAKYKIGDPNQLVIRVFSGDIEGTTPPVCVAFCLGPGVTIQQEFEVFTHVFHNYLPPDGWRFTDTNEAPAPPS